MAEDMDYQEESAEYSPKSEFSKPAVVMETVQKCIKARAKEMRNGYYNTTVTKEGFPLRVWIEDTRKVYVSSVTALKRLLIPEILNDSNYKETKKKEDHPIGKINEKMKTGKEEYSYYFLEGYTEEGKKKYKKTKKCFMPEIDAVVKIRKIFPDGNEQLLDMPKFWNQYINSYWDLMVELNDDLFEELMRVLHRLNYFKQSVNF